MSGTAFVANSVFHTALVDFTVMSFSPLATVYFAVATPSVVVTISLSKVPAVEENSTSNS